MGGKFALTHKGVFVFDLTRFLRENVFEGFEILLGVDCGQRIVDDTCGNSFLLQGDDDFVFAPVGEGKLVVGEGACVALFVYKVFIDEAIGDLVGNVAGGSELQGFLSDVSGGVFAHGAATRQPLVDFFFTERLLHFWHNINRGLSKQSLNSVVLW